MISQKTAKAAKYVYIYVLCIMYYVSQKRDDDVSMSYSKRNDYDFTGSIVNKIRGFSAHFFELILLQI